MLDEKKIKLIPLLNNIFVAIAAALLLSAVGLIGSRAGFDGRHVPSPVGAVLVAGAAWGLTEFFTRRRRMALPSIVLLLAFLGAVLVGTGFAIGQVLEASGYLDATRGDDDDLGDAVAGLFGAICAAVTVVAAWFHWRRFRVPITVAAGAVALATSVIGTVLFAIPQTRGHELPLVFAGGIALFAVAIWWDMSDCERNTWRSDVAFWLHLAAAPMIAYSVFAGLGVFDGGIDAGTAFGVGLLYVLFAIVAIAINRRALPLVSSLVYMLFAMRTLSDTMGLAEFNVALTGLVIGSGLLTLSAFWHPIRRALVGQLPTDAQRYLPVLERAIPRPA